MRLQTQFDPGLAAALAICGDDVDRALYTAMYGAIRNTKPPRDPSFAVKVQGEFLAAMRISKFSQNVGGGTMIVDSFFTGAVANGSTLEACFSSVSVGVMLMDSVN